MVLANSTHMCTCKPLVDSKTHTHTMSLIPADLLTTYYDAHPEITERIMPPPPAFKRGPGRPRKASSVGADAGRHPALVFLLFLL